MKPELFYLVCTAVFTGLMWIPYIIDRSIVRGAKDGLGYPENPKPQSPWAQRLMKAHANAVENLVLFATLVLTANALGMSGGTIATASMVYFWARVAHAVIYAFAVPFAARTLSFTVAWVALGVIAWKILVG